MVLILFWCVNLQAQNFLNPVNNDTIRILPHLVGFNNQMASKNEPWYSSDYIRALKTSEVGLLRYPGGTVSNYWDMEKNRLFKNAATIDTADSNPRIWLKTENVIGWVVPMWPAVNSISNLQLAYNAMASSNTAKPAVVFVLNMITPGADYYTQKWQRKVDETPLSDDWWLMMNDRLRRNIKMLDNVMASGMEVKYAEFGNEYYFGQSRAGDGSNGGAIVEPYSAGAANTGLKGAFPGNGRSYANAVNNWADTLTKRYPDIRLSAIAADANSTSPSRRNSWNTEVVKYINKELVPAVSIHLYGGIEEGDFISTEENLGLAFSSWKHHWEWKKKYSSFPEDREYWITEYNPNKDKKKWGHGLMNLFFINTMLSEGKLGLSNYHQFAQNTIKGSGIYASTRVLALLAKATRGKTFAQKLELDNEIYLAGSEADKIPALAAWVFSSEEEELNHYFIGNFSSKSIDIDLANIEETMGQMYYYSANSLNTENDPGIKFGSLNNSIKLAPYSCYFFRAGGLLPVNTKIISDQNSLNIRIFPNPGDDRISFYINKNQSYHSSVTLKVYSITGVLKNEFSGEIKQIESLINKNLNNWKPGIYILRFQAEDFTQTIKWVKK